MEKFMYLKSLEIVNLYGNNYKLDFNRDLTILYGVNGSGKTTILNIISDICSGKIINLLRYKFDLLRVSFEETQLSIALIKEGKYQLKYNQKTAIISEGTQKIRISRVDALDSAEYTELEKWNLDYQREKKYTEELKYTKESTLISYSIKKLFEFTYISLDRNVYGLKEEIGNKYLNSYRRKIGEKNTGIHQTLMLADHFYINYEESILREERKIQNNLEKNLLEKMAEPLGEIDFTSQHESINVSRMSEILLKETTGKLKDNISNLINIYNKNRNNYLKMSKHINQKGSTVEIQEALRIMISEKVAYAQLEKIYQILEKTTALRSKIDFKKQKLRNTLESINILLKDTHKKVLFKEQKGLYFLNLNTHEELPLKYLSSGEIQLVIFMVFSLVRNQSIGKSQKLVLIDEPELSLHITWQEQILPLLTKYREDSQIIIATHSPDIIGEMSDKCVEVRGYE